MWGPFRVIPIKCDCKPQLRYIPQISLENSKIIKRLHAGRFPQKADGTFRRWISWHQFPIQTVSFRSMLATQKNNVPIFEGCDLQCNGKIANGGGSPTSLKAMLMLVAKLWNPPPPENTRIPFCERSLNSFSPLKDKLQRIQRQNHTFCSLIGIGYVVTYFMSKLPPPPTGLTMPCSFTFRVLNICLRLKSPKNKKERIIRRWFEQKLSN